MNGVNIPELRKAVEWVEEQAELARRGLPSEWDQALWVSEVDRYNRQRNTDGNLIIPAPCGTVCCVAGHVALEHGCYLDADDHFRAANGAEAFAPDVAEKVLGLNQVDASDLFDPSNTSADVRRIAEQIAGEPL